MQPALNRTVTTDRVGEHLCSDALPIDAGEDDRAVSEADLGTSCSRLQHELIETVEPGYACRVGVIDDLWGGGQDSALIYTMVPRNIRSRSFRAILVVPWGSLFEPPIPIFNVYTDQSSRLSEWAETSNERALHV